MGFLTRPALAMISEFMQRGSLFKVMSKQRGASLDTGLQRAVAIGVARGMAYLHSRSPPILHLVGLRLLHCSSSADGTYPYTAVSGLGSCLIMRTL